MCPQVRRNVFVSPQPSSASGSESVGASEEDGATGVDGFNWAEFTITNAVDQLRRDHVRLELEVAELSIKVDAVESEEDATAELVTKLEHDSVGSRKYYDEKLDQHAYASAEVNRHLSSPIRRVALLSSSSMLPS